MLLVRTDPQAPKHKGITFLLVDMHSPGVTVRPLRQITGEEDFNEVFFEDVRVPRANVVGALNGGWDIAIATLMHERQTLTFSRQLQSRVALNRLLALARRYPRGRPAAAEPRLRQKLAAAYIDSEAMRYTALRNLTRVLRGGTPGPEGSIEKLFWSEMYQRMLDTAVEMTGPFAQLVADSAGAVENGLWPHLMLYSRGRTIAAGSSEIQRNIIAERVLGLPRAK
jgi:alkylation response protein AidB-like acyl-CoA dehydrogenase